jgi:hypothetical protein
MADVDIPQAREAVDIFVSLRVAQHRSAPLDDDQRLPVIIRMVQRVHEIAPVSLE